MGEKQWWNQPIIGAASLTEQVTKLFVQNPPPDNVIALHRRYLGEVKSKALHVYRIQVDKFDNTEFKDYSTAKMLIEKNSGHYKGLKRAIQFIELAITTAESYLLISETELQYRSPIQNNIYRFVSHTLDRYNAEAASQIINERIRPYLDQVKTEKGRLVISNYLNAVDEVAKYPLGLELLNTFKKSTYSYTVLRTIATLGKTLNKSEVSNLQKIILQVQEKEEIFDQLGEMLNIPKEHQNRKSYARMLQFIALKHRYYHADREFENLLNRLKAWEKPYLKLNDIRQEYNAKDYALPKEFKEAIPALEIYQTYQHYLWSQQCEVNNDWLDHHSE